MSLDAAVLRESRATQGAFLGEIASDPAADILKHVVKIWARDHGVAEGDVSCLTDRVVAFARSAIVDCERKVQVLA